MSERICKGYKRACAEPLGELNRIGLCTVCYARKKYHERKPVQGGAVDIAVQPAKKAASKVSAPLSNAAEQTVSPVVLGETYEPGITLTLPASKVQRLFELLLR